MTKSDYKKTCHPGSRLVRMNETRDTTSQIETKPTVTINLLMLLSYDKMMMPDKYDDLSYK